MTSSWHHNAWNQEKSTLCDYTIIAGAHPLRRQLYSSWCLYSCSSWWEASSRCQLPGKLMWECLQRLNQASSGTGQCHVHVCEYHRVQPAVWLIHQGFIWAGTCTPPPFLKLVAEVSKNNMLFNWHTRVLSEQAHYWPRTQTLQIEEEKGPGTHCMHMCQLLHGSRSHFHSDPSKGACARTVVFHSFIWMVNRQIYNNTWFPPFFSGVLRHMCMQCVPALSPLQFKGPGYDATTLQVPLQKLVAEVRISNLHYSRPIDWRMEPQYHRKYVAESMILEGDHWAGGRGEGGGGGWKILRPPSLYLYKTMTWLSTYRNMYT